MSEKLTVLVDMDGVLAGFDDEAMARMADRHPHIPLLTTRTNFYLADDYPEHSELVRSLSDEEGFFAALPVADGALEGWAKIEELGYRPQICSSPISTNPTCNAEKIGWLEKHFVPVFGKYVVEQAIITKNKHEYDGIALIDDRPEVRHAEEASWQHIVMDKSYNKHASGPRLMGWYDPQIEEILDVAASRYAM